MPRYVLSPEARDDLREIRDYLAEAGGRRLARHVLQEIASASSLLASHPDAGHRRQDLTVAAGEILVGVSYLIVYDPAARPLAIVQVLHGRRDIANILDH